MTTSICEFCREPVFNDYRHVGTVVRLDDSMAHYHLVCLWDKYPDEEDYQELVIKLFKN